MSKSKILVTFFLCIVLNVFSQSEFTLPFETKIIDFPGSYYYTVEQTGTDVFFTEYDVENSEQSEVVLDLSSFVGSDSILFHSMTRYGNSNKFLLILRRNFTGNSTTFWEADTVENHYFSYNRSSQVISNHVVDTTFDRGVKLESYSDNEIYKFDLTGYDGSSSGNGQSATMKSINDELQITQLAHPDSITTFNGQFGWFKIYNDSLYIFDYYGTVDFINLYLLKFDLFGSRIESTYTSVSSSSYTSIKGLRFFSDSIFMVRSEGSSYPQNWSFLSKGYNFETRHLEYFSHPANLLMYDGEIDYLNRHVLFLARDINASTNYPMKILIYDFIGNLVCESQIPYHYLNTEVGLELINEIVYLKHAMNDSTYKWEPFTCGILNNSHSYIDELESFSFYPNPATEILMIDSHSNGRVVINDMEGRKVLGKDLNLGQSSLNVSSLNPGNYILQFTSNTKMIQRKFVKL